MHRDPSRGRKHIVVRQVKYTPEESDLRYRSTITHAGVFKLDDCWDAIDEVMSGHTGEGREMVRDVLNDIDSTSGSSGRDVVPMLDLTFGDGVQPWLGSSEQLFMLCSTSCLLMHSNLNVTVAIASNSLRHRPYDADWRKSINKKGVAPPDAILKFKNAVDVEHKFD